MNKTNLHVLLTRPQKKSEALAKKLAPLTASVTIQPLFEYQPGQDLHELASKITKIKPEIAIFISEASVKFALSDNALFQYLEETQIIAIGAATTKVLNDEGFDSVLTAKPATSEGLLTLPILQQVNGRNIVIFRGNGGRELIASTLRERGAAVDYVETYHRQWLPLAPEKTSDQWRKKKINCIVVTSNDILTHLWEMLTANGEHKSYWQSQCVWYVVSKRIYDNAKHLGITQVTNLNGANDKTVIEGITQ